MPDLTLIIISWNSKDYLQECLESLWLNSSKLGLEVIVVDNASTDGSPEMVEERFPQAKLVRNETNVGFARANNIGLSMSNGRYLCLVNSDVHILPNCLEHLHAFMEKQTFVGMVGPKVYNADGTVQYSCRRFPSLWSSFSFALGLYLLFPRISLFANEQMSDFGYDQIRSVDSLSGCFLMVRRKAVEEVGLLDERFFIYSEDVDWCKRFHDKQWEVVFYPEAEIVHYGGGSSKNAPAKFAVEQDRAKLQYWTKHHGNVSLKVLKSLILLRYALKMFRSAIYCMSGTSSKETARTSLSSYFWCFKKVASF